MAKIRLLPFLMRSGKFKDSHEIEKLIQEGRIRVNHRVVHSKLFEFRPVNHTVYIDNKPVATREEQLYFMFHKPEGVVCQKNDAMGRPSVWDYLKKHSKLSESEIQALATVGRLDLGTSGLILLTTDGELVNKVAQPASGIEKEYHVVADGSVGEDLVERLRKGVDIPVEVEGKTETVKTKPCTVTVVSRNAKETALRIVLKEGKKRQVRMMMRAVGHPVITLRRERVGGVSLGALELGGLRKFAKEELTSLLFSCE
jgi:pseudouridine synthase